MSGISRRGFLKGIAAGAAGVAARGLLPGAKVLGANDDLRIAVVGFKSRGMNHIESLLKIKGVRIVALCDVDPHVLSSTQKTLEEKHKTKVDATYSDIRKLLESKEIDAITTATPNHWHSLIGIWACQAGKDAYIEKPISHNVWEGGQLVKAARKYNRIVQGGSQSRSSSKIAEAIEWIKAGNIGAIKLGRGLCFKPRQSIGKVGTGEIPAGLDYDLWCGPAPKVPLKRKNLHYDWHWVYDTGNGDMGNQGIHQMDVARWMIGENELSPRVMSIGGRLGYEDDGETPNTQFVYHAYEKAPLIFETRGLPKGKEFQTSELWTKNMDSAPGVEGNASGIGVVIECAGGKVYVSAGGSAAAYDQSGKKMKDFAGQKDEVEHMQNFIDAVRSRKPEMLKAECKETHLSSALCHTGLISHRLGQAAKPGEILEKIKSDAVAEAGFDAMKEHLGKNGVDLDKTPLALGPWLKFDPKTERFIDNDAANAMLTRDYRKGFEVPKEV